MLNFSGPTADTSTMQLLRGLLGVAVILGIAVTISRHRRAIQWRVVVSGLLLEAVLAALLFRTEAGKLYVAWLTAFAEKFLSFSFKGSEFVFGSLGLDSGKSGGSFHLAFQVLPIVIYFSAVTSALYRLRVLQVVVYAAGRTLGKLLGVSGA